MIRGGPAGREAGRAGPAAAGGAIHAYIVICNTISYIVLFIVIMFIGISIIFDIICFGFILKRKLIVLTKTDLGHNANGKYVCSRANYSDNNISKHILYIHMYVCIYIYI